jgi:Ala-tRNA(Pro) deacylase
MRIPEILAERSVPFETLIHPPAFTAQKRAKFLHLPGAQVAKCVLLIGPKGRFLAVLPASRHIDVQRLQGLLGGPVRVADCDEVADTFRDCEWGVVAPFGTLYGLTTLIEESLSVDAFIVLETNSHAEAIRMRCRDFEQLERPQRLHFAR